MTLSRQLISTISAIFLIALIGIEVIHLRSAQRHLQESLESLAQDAATSLGLSLGVLMSRGDDAAVAATVINAAFDRGHYQRIEFVSLSGATRVSRSLGAGEDVEHPGWFAELFPLNAPTAESLVSAGWRQLGSVRVTAHPRFAYAQLWRTARNTLIYLLAIYVAAFALLRLFLRSVLRPLAAVERAAQAISAREFVTLEEKPATRELARVVAAMNSLSGKVRDAFAREAARARELQQAATFDEVSGLLNRRGFVERFDGAWQGERGDAFAGAFALLQIPELGSINQRLGRERCDALLRAVGRTCAEAASNARDLAGRWSGSQFALALAGRDAAAARAALAALQARAASAMDEFLDQGAGALVGAAQCRGAAFALDALERAALAALARAAAHGEDTVEMQVLDAAAGEETVMRRLQVVEEAVAARRLQLLAQSAISLADGATLHVEIIGRLLDASGAELAAAEFMPVVSQHGLSAPFDRAVIARVIESARASPVPVAVNVSARSIRDAAFVRWLAEALAAARAGGARFVFELTEHGVLQDEAAAAEFAAMLARAGAGFAIDHFGVHRDSLALVQRLKPAYLKLAGLHTGRLAGDAGTRFFFDAVAHAAAQLDIPVIAQNVEDAATLEALRQLRVAGYQGYIAGRPAPWGAA